MLRRLVISVLAILALVVLSFALPAQAGHGGGGGGPRGGGGGGGGHGGGGMRASVGHFGGHVGGGHIGHMGALHSAHLGGMHAGHHALGSHVNRHLGTRTNHHTNLARHGIDHHGKLASSHHLAGNKFAHNFDRHDRFSNHHDHRFFGRRVFAVWYGSIFWPYAFYDLFDYVFWVCDSYYYYSYGCYDGYGPFWAYGYDDLFGGIYWPYYSGNYGYGSYGYGSADRGRRTRVARNDAQQTTRGARPNELAQLCGGEAASFVHFPFDRIEQRVKPTDAQRASFEELKSAAADAADKLIS